jgi:hypothetical protein
MIEKEEYQMANRSFRDSVNDGAPYKPAQVKRVIKFASNNLPLVAALSADNNATLAKYFPSVKEEDRVPFFSGIAFGILLEHSRVTDETGYYPASDESTDGVADVKRDLALDKMNYIC